MHNLGRKTLAVFAPLAIFAALLIGPSLASAEVFEPAEWTVNGEPLPEGNTEGVEFSGRLSITGALGSVECNVSGTDDIFNVAGGATKAQDEITAFNIEPGANCVTTEALTGCTVAATSTTAAATPWPTQASLKNGGADGNIEIKNVEFTNTFGGTCPFAGATLKVGGPGEEINGTVTFGVDESSPCFPYEVKEIDFENAGPLSTEPNIGPVVVNGSVTVTPENADCVNLDPES